MVYTYIRQTSFLILFGKRLRQLRVSKNITQDELAFGSGLAISQIGRIERGQINTGVCTIYVLAKALGVQPKDLFDFSIENENNRIK